MIWASASCGSSRTFPARPSLLESSTPLTREVSPGEWRYHPREPAPLARAYELGEGKTLFVGGRGERWLLDRDAERAEPASMLAPEALVGALEIGEGAWKFIGQSGTAYAADSPMASFSSSTPPLDRLARVESGTSHVLGIRRDGQLTLSEDAGSSWHEVGPTGARFADILLSSPHAFALELPERLWWSSDEGRTWQELQEPPFGAHRLTRDEEAGAVVVSALGVRRVSLESPPRLTPVERALRPAEPVLSRPPREGPSAKAITAGRAFEKNDAYFEIELGVKAHSISGQITGALRRREAPVFSACNDIEIAGFDAWIYAACTRERSGATRQYEFFRSEDGGQHFEREEYVARADPEHLRLAVGQGGALLATGVCSPRETSSGCRPQGIMQRRQETADAGQQVELQAIAAPALEESALGLAFSADGLTAYAVGQRTKSDGLFVFVSANPAHGFTARPIAHLSKASPSGPIEVHALSAANGGQLSIVLSESSGQRRLVLLDASARTLSVNGAPLETASVGAYGSRAIAVSSEEAWESLNGGADWRSIGRLPAAVCAASGGRCSVPIHCRDSGCTIGDNLSREGWRGQSMLGIALLTPPPRHAGTSRRAVGPTWSCELSGSEWKELTGVHRIPDASQAALGKAAWFALSTDDATAAAGLWIAEAATPRLESPPSVRYAELLAPVARASDVAYLVTLQVEGAAALRYKIPGAVGASKTHLTEVEVAWNNLLEQQAARGVIPDAGPHVAGDYLKGEGMARRAQADLVSISSGGIYVRVHRHPQHDQTSYFLDGSGIQEVPPLRWLPPPPKGANSEMARLGAHHVPLLFTQEGSTVVRARRHGAIWQFDAMTVGFADLDSFAIRQQRDIAYVDGRAGVQLTTRRPGASTESHIFPLQADGAVFGPAISVPTQADLRDPLTPCGPRARASSPRVVSPHHPGRRRPLLVHDAVEPLRLMLSDSAVLRGSKDEPCAEVFDAEPVQAAGSAGAMRERALVSPGGPSWLFRLSPDSSRREPRVEYRSMRCKTEPGVDPPVEVYEMPGTRQDG